MAKKRVAIVAGALGTILLVAWLVVRSRSSSTPPFRLALVERGSIQQTVSATGTLSAIKTVQVGTRVSGLVAELHADFNDHVTKGQLLARIDPTLQEQAVTDATAQLGKAQAEYDQAKAEYDRNQPLYAQKFISGTDFTTFQTNLAVGLAGLKSAQVALDEAKQNLTYTNIYAPINGVVIVRSVDLGQTVAASLSAPQLFLIAQDLTQIQILAAVDESDIAAVKDSQVVKFTVEAYPDTFTAVVSTVRLQSQLTDNVVNYTVVVTIDNADGRLLPGMTATVQFITGSATDVLVVPNLALRYRPTAAQLASSGVPPLDTSSHGGMRDTGSAARGAGAPVTHGTAGRGGANGGKRPVAGSAGSIGTLYVLDQANKIKVFRVLVGLSDGQRTQVTSDSLAVGMQVIVGTGVTASVTASASSTNPLTPQRPAGGGRGGP